jgi:hypothetical protein
VAATAQGDALAVEPAVPAVSVAAGRVAATRVAVRAVQAGEAKLQLAVTLGTFTDRSERTLTVAADRVAHPLVTAASGTGEVAVALPEGASPEDGMVVDVMQGGAEAWRLLEADLAQYPYGCAEQTLSRLVPYFAVVRAAKQRGETPSAMDAAFAQRLRTGLQRLRQLQDHGDGFAFWPGQDGDPAFTGLVLHGLALLRQGGIDLEAAGLDVQEWRFRRELAATDSAPVVDAAFLANAELLAGVLRLQPDAWVPLRSLQPAVAVLLQLPAGLCARLGLALHAAGDLDGARACRQRLSEARLPMLSPDGFPGEDPLAVQALRLELDIALEAPLAAREQAAAGLLLACLRGDGSTYARACALAVLAQVLPRTEAKPGRNDASSRSAPTRQRRCAVGCRGRRTWSCAGPPACR